MTLLAIALSVHPLAWLASLAILVGLAQATSGGNAAIAHVGALDASAVKELQDTFCEGAQTVLTGAADAIPFPGVIQLNSSGVDACTLATPIAGPQPAGDDGKSLFIYDNSGQAHTVTTAANKIINSKHVLTWNGTKGSNISLMAQGGVWVPVGTPSGVTIS